MVDLNKVSQAVQKFVADVAKTEGNKKSIDTKNEYDKLGAYLSGNGDSMNISEKEFIQGFMIEYEAKEIKKAQKSEQKRVEEQTSDYVKDTIKDIAKRQDKKKKIDTDEEANALAIMLRNTKGDLNKADIEYIKNILIESGFESYIQEQDETKETPPNVIPQLEEEIEAPAAPPEDKNNIAIEDKGSNTKLSENETGLPPHSTKSEKAKPKKVRKPLPRKTLPRETAEPSTPPKVIPEEPSVSTAPRIKQYITEGGRNKGLKLARLVIDELKSNIADNEKIKASLRSVDRTSAHTFIGQFANKNPGGLNQDVFSISDLFNKLDYGDTLHVMSELLQQAKSMGLESNPAYKALQKEVEYGKTAYSRRTEVDPEPKTQRQADSALNWLYNEMNKAMQKAEN